MSADFKEQHSRHDPSRGPLSRFTIIDASRVRAGPTAMRVFADMGARVIKLEIPSGAPGGDDMIGGRDHNRADYENLHRNKESLTLNMKDPAGLEILRELVQRADVFIENFRPDVKDRLGIGYEALRAVNPRLVYASISGFGQDGPYAKWPGFDSIAQGMGGLMSLTGKPGDGPMRVGIPIADLCSGHFCAQAIMTALLEREASGEGQWVQTSLLEAQIAMLDFQAAQWLVDRKVPEQVGNEHPLTVPTGVFPTRDGFLNLAAIGNSMFARLCEALDLPHLVGQPGYESDPARVENRDTVNEDGRRSVPHSHHARVDGAADQGRRAVRPNLQDQRSIRRSAGQASGYRVAGQRAGQGRSVVRRHAVPSVSLSARADAAPRTGAGRAYAGDPERAWLRRSTD